MNDKYSYVPEDRPDFWDLWDDETLEAIHDRYGRVVGNVFNVPRSWLLSPEARNARAKQTGNPGQRFDMASHDWPAPLRGVSRDGEEEEETESTETSNDQ